MQTNTRSFMRARKFSRARTMFRATMGNSSILSYPPPLFPTKLSFLPEQAFHGIVLSQAPALRPACISSAHFRVHTSHTLTAFRRADDGREHIGVGGQGAARRRRARTERRREGATTQQDSRTTSAPHLASLNVNNPIAADAVSSLNTKTVPGLSHSCKRRAF